MGVVRHLTERNDQRDALRGTRDPPTPNPEQPGKEERKIGGCFQKCWGIPHDGNVCVTVCVSCNIGLHLPHCEISITAVVKF